MRQPSASFTEPAKAPAKPAPTGLEYQYDGRARSAVGFIPAIRFASFVNEEDAIRHKDTMDGFRVDVVSVRHNRRKVWKRL